MRNIYSMGVLGLHRPTKRKSSEDACSSLFSGLRASYSNRVCLQVYIVPLISFSNLVNSLLDTPYSSLLASCITGARLTRHLHVLADTSSFFSSPRFASSPSGGVFLENGFNLCIRLFFAALPLAGLLIEFLMSVDGVAIEASSVEKSALFKPEPGEVTVPHTSDSHHLGQIVVLCCSLKD